MGSCFSKPERSQKAQDAPRPAAATVRQEQGGNQPVQSYDEQQGHHPSAVSGPGPPSPTVEGWTAADVVRWASGLGLGPQAAAALQGCTGEQLLQLTDKGLLQLGVQDAAERQALLTARRSLQQQQQQQQQTLQQPQQQQQQQQPDAVQASNQQSGTLLMLPPANTPVSGVAGQGSQGQVAANGAMSPETGGSLDGDSTKTKAAAVRFAPTPTNVFGEPGAPGTQRASGDLSPRAQHVEQGETQDIQVLRITAAGRFFRHNRPVPVLLVPLCQAVCMLHDVRRGAHYHQDNCHHLLQRCILVQDYLLALPLTELLQHGVLLAQLSLLMQDMYDVFNQFSDRGWLLRLLGPVKDQDDFNRLDQQLVTALQQAGVDTSEPPLTELTAARRYQPQQQQLESALKQLGITRLLRDPLSAMLRLQSLLNHLPSGSNIEVLLQQEIDFFLSSCMQYPENGSSSASREDSFSRVGSGSDSSVLKANGPGSGNSSTTLRRSSSSGFTAAGRGRAAGGAAVEPFMVLRNDTVRAEWRSIFGSRERITWKEFWHKLVQPQAHIWGLDRQLDKFTTDYVQQHLQRGLYGLLTLSELDFAFPPNVSPAMIVQARLKGHASVSSAGLPPVNFGAKNTSSKGSKQAGGIGWLREVRLLQEPNPRLHNFPEFPSSYMARDEEVSELGLSVADVSTNLVMLTGAQGLGRSMLAASLAQELVSSHHWTDAYWIDMQGVTNVVLAGQQLMSGLGLVGDISDTQQLLAWLEQRPRERFGIVLTHIQGLLGAPTEEQQGFLDLLDNILHSSQKLQVVVVCEEALPRTPYSARTVDVGPLTTHLATEMVREAQPGVSDEHCQTIVEVCYGAPVALAVVCNLLRYGHCDAAEFIRLYSDPRLPLERTTSNTTSNHLAFESRTLNERLQRVVVAAIVNLPDALVSSLFVLSFIPAPFTLDLVAPLLALAQTKTEKHAVLRRLVTLGFLSYNAALQQYSMHKVVREAACLLVHNLDLPYSETRHNYAERVVASARHLVLPLMKQNRMLSARLAWSRLAVHVVQLLNWAFQEVKPEILHLYVSLAWDLTPLLSSSCSSHTLQGFCQMVLERSQFLDSNLESAKMMTVLASLLAESGALKRADTLLRQALELFWRELKDHNPAIARCYRELGALMLKAGKAAEAAKHLQQALDIKEPLYGGTSPELLTILQLQVELLRRSRKYAEAEHVCQRALGICGAAYGPSDVQVAFWKNQLAQVLRQAGRPSEAQSLSEESLSLLQGQLGTEHPRVAAQLMILGQLAAQQNKQAAAEQTFRKALQVYQTVSGLHHPDTFNCLTSLVALLRGAGKASQALPLAQRCLGVKKKSLGELHPDTAASMQVVADVMLDLGRYAEVETNCSRAVWVYQQISQPANSRPVITATTMQALALVLLGRASEAEQLATSCLEAAKQLPGPVAERNSFVASCHNCLGEVYREMGRLADSEAAAREGLAMREKDMGPAHPVVAISLQTLGHVLRLRHELAEGLEVAKRCEALRAASSSQAQGPQMAAALFLQALIYMDMGNLTEAYEKAQAALTMRQKVLSSDHPDLAHSLAAVAEIYLLQNRFMDAEPLLSHAVQIFIAQLGSSHPATQRAHTLLKQANNPHTASSSISMAMRLASDSTDQGSSRLASRDISRSNSLARQASSAGAAAAAAAIGAAPGSVDAAGQAVGAAGSGAAQAAGNAAAEAGAAAGSGVSPARQPSAAEGIEAQLTAALSCGPAGRTGSSSTTGSLEHRLSDPQSAAGSTHSYATTGTGIVSISTHIGAVTQQSSSPAPGNAMGYLDMQQTRTSDAFARSGSLQQHLPSSELVRVGSAAAVAIAEAAARTASGASVTGADAGSGSLPAAAAAAEAAGVQVGPGGTAVAQTASVSSLTKAISLGELPGSGGSSGAAAAAASTQANPEQWELGRQLGQPVAAGTAEPDTGAYNMVLAELTRRASNAGTPEDDKEAVALHEEGLSKAAAAQRAQEAAKAPQASPTGTDSRPGMPPAPPTAKAGSSGGAPSAAGAAAAGAAAAAVAGAGAAAMAARGSRGGTTLHELSDTQASGEHDGPQEVPDAEAVMVLAAADGGVEGGALGEGQADQAPVLQSKMAQLQGLADIESLTNFLREHGWQLSRLTDERELGLGRAQVGSVDASEPIAGAAGAMAAAAAADGAGLSAVVSGDLDLPKSAPLPAAELPLRGVQQGDGLAAGMEPGALPMNATPRQWGPFAAASQVPPEHSYQHQQRPRSQPLRRPPARHYSFMQSRPQHLENAWSSGYPRSPRTMRRGATPPFGLAGGPHPEEWAGHPLGLQGGGATHGNAFAYQQRLQRLRMAEASGYDIRNLDAGSMEDEEELADHMYYSQQHLQPHEQAWMGAHPGMQGRGRPVTSHASIGTRSMTAADVAHMLEAMHQQYPVMQQYDDDAHAYSAALGVVPGSSSMHMMGRQQQQQQQQQLGTAWSAGPLPAGAGAGGFGVPRGPAGAPGRSRPRRRQSFDTAAHRASQPSQSSQIWGPAAAAAAAECGYPQQLNMSSEIEQLQLQQQHLSSVYAAAAQQWPDASSMQQHQGLAQEQGSGSGAMPAAVQGPGTLGSGSSSNRGSGHSGSYTYGQQQQQQQRDMLAAAASGALGPAAAAAAVLHGQRSSASQQQGPLSPAASADPQSLPAGAGRAASTGMPSMLPKYPSNISNYSAASVASARSVGPGQDGQAPLGHGPASGGSQQQQGGEDGASGAPAAAPGAMASGRGSRLGALSPETVGSSRQEQQQQQQPLNLVAARARSALGITRQGSGHSLGDMSPNMISPRQQQQQQGSEGATPASSAPASARSGRTARQNVSFNNRQQQQQHYSGGHVEDMMLHEQQLQQQHLEADTSPRYATSGYRGTPASLQHRQQMLNHARSAGAALQHQQLYADDDGQGYGVLSPGAHQGYMEGEDGGPWPADLHSQHGLAAAMAAAASSGLHGPAAPAQYPYMSGLHAGSGPTSTGSTQGRVSTYARLAAALSSLGYHPHLAGPGSSNNQQMMMASMYPQHAAGDAAGWDMDMGAAVGEEDDSIAAATRVVMLQQQVASVQAARAELQSQQQEIEELLAFKQLPEAEQERILEMLAAQFQQVQQQQQQQQMHRQQMLQRPVSPHVGPLNVLGTGMGSSSSNVQARLPRGPQGPSSYMGPGGGQSGMVSPEAPAGAGQGALMASGSFLQRATSTASTASIGSPKSTHSARTRASIAAALAGAAAAGTGRPSTPEQAAAVAEAALLESQAEAAAALLAQQQQQHGLVNVNGSSAPSPSSSQPPGSPTGSRSTPSRSALSRGASGSYDANTHGLQPATGSAGSGGASPGRLGSATSSKGALMGQRSISPDRLRRPASAAAVLSQQQQQKPLHRLHRDNSYDQQIGEAAEAAGMAAAQRAGSVGPPPPQQQQQQQQRSPTNGPMRGPPVPGMPPMPATAWQQREQQLPQQYVQMMLAQQQQQQQQLQLPQQALPRRPARMSSPSPYVAVPTSPMGYQSGYMPSSATAAAAAYASQQQQQLLQSQGSGHQSGQLALSGSRVGLQGLQGMGGPPSGGRAPAGQPTRSAAVAAAAAAVLRGATSPVGMAGAGGRVASYSAGMAARPLPMQQQQQPAMPGMGYAAHGHPQLAAAGLGSGTAGGPVPLTQQQISNLVLRQQQLRQQQMAAHQAHYGALQQQQQQQQQQHEADQMMLQYDPQGGSQEAEDYGLWATPPDYGGSGYADEGGSSRGASGSRTLLAPSGGQYWQGRRSNSWSNNMAEVVLGADEVAASPHSQTLPRSRSSEDVPMVMQGGPEQH